MINVKVTSVSITKGEMVVTVSTTNTNFPGITQTYSVVDGAAQTLEGVIKTIDGAAKMMWAGYNEPSWNIVEE